VEAQHLGFRVLSAETLLHDAGPKAAGGAVFCDLLQEIVVRVKEEGKTLAEFIGVKTFFAGCLSISYAVRQCKRHLLNSGAARLPDVIAGY
jgi:hypothetical protein